MTGTIRKILEKNRNLLKYISAVLLAAVCGVTYCARQSGGVNDGVFYEESVRQTKQEDESVQDTAEELYYVYVCGCVNSPGVYPCSPGSRVYELISLAGGFSEQADESSLNLAGNVEDGMRLYVPREGENAGAQASGININTATAEQLMALPGIGEARAADIVNYRMQHGGFASVEDIMNVPGIKEAAYEKIKDKICV